MSPLTLEKIKKAKGNVKIVEDRSSNTSVTVTNYQIQVLEDGAWKVIYTDRDRTVCEAAIRGANNRLLLG